MGEREAEVRVKVKVELYCSCAGGIVEQVRKTVAELLSFSNLFLFYPRAAHLTGLSEGPSPCS